MPPDRRRRKAVNRRAPDISHHSRNGNQLFASLPAEIRFLIWEYTLIDESGYITPKYKHRASCIERFMDEQKHQTVNTLNSVLQTCRLFWIDQEINLTFYKFNNFSFGSPFDLVSYILAITPKKRRAIRYIGLLNPEPIYHIPWSFNPIESLRTLTLCRNLRTIRYRYLIHPARQPMTNPLVNPLFESLENIARVCPLLRSFTVSAGNQSSNWFKLKIDRESWSLTPPGPIGTL
ncbi:hypothetical protein PT974_10425 [Cladobotryum mycophilum]|uniref:Uncharacterized protein n=1 Tax=Cladobotryum mycophilum TaxID=491253 RepID=A0ABR0S9U4_9HYPO